MLLQKNTVFNIALLFLLPAAAGWGLRSVLVEGTSTLIATDAIKSGTFRDADRRHRGSGRATILQMDDGSYVLELKDFRVSRGPGLRVILAGHPSPSSRNDIKSQTYVDLGKLKENRGDQSYAIPSDLDLGAYNSVVIYCKPFHVIFSVAPLVSNGLRLSFDGLEDLGAGWAYEGWLIVDGAPVSTGVFTVNAEGVPSATDFMADGLSEAAAFVLTIEPVPDPEPTPSTVHVLAGGFNSNTAQLSAAHAAALGDDFRGATGSFILAAPSSGSASYKNGLWWLNPNEGPGPSLELPKLPDGWVYEGWVVGPDGPISTGRFGSASGADSDGAGPSSGRKKTPPFPGQDFVNPRVDLTSGYAAVISIEPERDNSPAPFAFKPLVDMNIDDVGKGGSQAMGNHASSFPTGTAKR